MGAATAVRIAEANQVISPACLGLEVGRDTWEISLATAATVTNKFCLDETQRTISKLISILLEISYKIIVAL